MPKKYIPSRKYNMLALYSKPGRFCTILIFVIPLAYFYYYCWIFCIIFLHTITAPLPPLLLHHVSTLSGFNLHDKYPHFHAPQGLPKKVGLCTIIKQAHPKIGPHFKNSEPPSHRKKSPRVDSANGLRYSISLFGLWLCRSNPLFNIMRGDQRLLTEGNRGDFGS